MSHILKNYFIITIVFIFPGSFLAISARGRKAVSGAKAERTLTAKGENEFKTRAILKWADTRRV
jgi:hypothetical protein